MTSHIADYGMEEIEIVRGDGCHLYDASGREYLDFVAGWCVGNIGWKNVEVALAIAQMAESGKPYVMSTWRHQAAEELAAQLTSLSPGKTLARAFRCTSGSEAVEFAIKCARSATGRKTIVSIEDVYHGHTYGAASLGNACDPQVMGFCAPGFRKLKMPNAYRDVSGSDVIAQFKRILESEDGNDVAAFMSEPVWTNAGAIVPPADFYPRIQELCRKRDVLFIMDEVATCSGRCGTYFASELWGLQPDILCMGKGLTGGYATMGATLTTEDVFRGSRDVPSYSTFGWIPQDLAATRAVQDIIIRDQLWENARTVGKVLLQELRSLEEFDCVGEVRGIGLVLGVEIVEDKASKKKDSDTAGMIRKQCAQKGLLLETARNALFITPPLILTEAQAKEGAGILREVMESM